jgi:hypothetical protein
MLRVLRQPRHVPRLIVTGSSAPVSSLELMSSWAIALRHAMSAHSFLRRSSLPRRSRSTWIQMSSPKRAKSSAIELGYTLCRSSALLLVRFSRSSSAYVVVDVGEDRLAYIVDSSSLQARAVWVDVANQKRKNRSLTDQLAAGATSTSTWTCISRRDAASRA